MDRRAQTSAFLSKTGAVVVVMVDIGRFLEGLPDVYEPRLFLFAPALKGAITP
jgi:Ni/Fe-hydrogenase subunit HybB-like protein